MNAKRAVKLNATHYCRLITWYTPRIARKITSVAKSIVDLVTRKREEKFILPHDLGEREY